jgi:glycosyltransferase 2 family protein
LAVFLSYAFSVEAWRRVMAGWSQQVPYWRSTRIWLVANLGRYVPGKVWSVAGLVILAERAGVAPWAAAASAVAIQAIAIGTAIVVVAVATPGAVSPLRLVAGMTLAGGIIAVLASARSARLVARLMGKQTDIRPLPMIAVAQSSAMGVLAWVTHGVAFWLLARGLGLPDKLSVITAAGVFPLGYVLGLLALFAPGGIGVREIVLTSLLAPTLGMGGAVALSLASRILLTLTEVVAPGVALLISRQRKEEVSEST